MFELIRSQLQMITFVMVDSTGAEVTGLGSGFALQIAKGSGAFAASTGVKGEIGSGWYHYSLTAAETDTPGPLSVLVTGAGAVQQNLVYLIEGASVDAIDFTYTLTNQNDSQPIAGATVWISTDSAGDNIVWVGTTDAFGVARDNNGNIPRLNSGTYYFWRMKSGFTFNDPDQEVVS